MTFHLGCDGESRGGHSISVIKKGTGTLGGREGGREVGEGLMGSSI